MSCSVKLRVRCGNRRIAEKLESVLLPDNKAIPSDLTFSMRRRSNRLYFEAYSARLRSPVTTVASLLSDVVIFREIWLISRSSGTRARGGVGC
ncbi:MAG: hypothetical protein JRN24_00935 [Nitrososphaerota archaeon]|nr:hypothetical protein [Nitrososphaerota archaeon]